MIKKIAFVAYPTRDLDAAKAFFGDLLGLELDVEMTSDAGSWVEFKSPDGKTIALDMFSPQNSPDARTYMALETDDIDAEVARMKEHGVQVVMDTWTAENEQGELVCKMAIVLDPDGNPLMLHEIAPDRA